MSGNDSFAALSTSLTLCLDMFAARAIAFCDRLDARSLRVSLVSAAWTAVTYQGTMPIGISAVPNNSTLDVSGWCLSAISLASKRAISH